MDLVKAGDVVFRVKCAFGFCGCITSLPAAPKGAQERLTDALVHTLPGFTI